MFSKFSRLRWNEILKYATLAAVFIAVVVVVIVRRDTHVLAKHIGITVYPSGAAVVQVPYRRDGAAGTMTIMVDGRVAVDAAPAHAVKYSNDNYFFQPQSVLGRYADIIVTYDAAVRETTHMRAAVTHADTSTSDIDESTPTAVAQSLIALAKAHDADDKLPADPRTVIDELKHEMRWTASEGVSPDNVAGGANRWAAKKGLPIHTEKITGDSNTVLDEISRTLDAGGTAQAYVQFRRAGRIIGGRSVGVVRVVQIAGDAFIGIRDTAGPAGTSVYPVRDGTIVGYAFSDDTAVVGFGFVQTWNQ